MAFYNEMYVFLMFCSLLKRNRRQRLAIMMKSTISGRRAIRHSVAKDDEKRVVWFMRTTLIGHWSFFAHVRQVCVATAVGNIFISYSFYYAIFTWFFLKLSFNISQINWENTFGIEIHNTKQQTSNHQTLDNIK